MDDSRTPVVRANVEEYPLDDGLVVRDPVADRVHTLNVTAAYIWNLLDGSRSLREIALDLQTTGQIPLETAASDVASTVGHFQREGLLQSPQR